MLQYTQNTAKFKKGGEFRFDCVLQENNAPVVIPAGTQISCTVRTDTGNTVAAMNVVVNDQDQNAGSFSLTVKDTSNFPVSQSVYTVIVFDIDEQLFAAVTLITPIVA